MHDPTDVGSSFIMTPPVLASFLDFWNLPENASPLMTNN